MPISHAMKQSPQGALFVRTYQSGKVTGEDARHFMRLLAPGQPLHGLPVLSVIESGSEFDPEARKVFTSLGEPADAANAARVAVVVSSAPLRVMMSFIIRISGSNDFTRFFTTEREAESWLHAPAQAA